jgi:thiamine thiazole synthase
VYNATAVEDLITVKDPLKSGNLRVAGVVSNWQVPVGRYQIGTLTDARHSLAGRSSPLLTVFKAVRARVEPMILTYASIAAGMDPQTITAPVVCSFAGHE